MDAEELEKIAAEIHQVYCAQYEKNFGKPYRTGGDYSKLDEPTKEYDRNLVRWHLAKTDKLRNRAIRAEAKIPTENGCTCGNLVYCSNAVGNTGHMMNCPVYREMSLLDELEQTKRDLRLAKCYKGIEGAPCPLCEYDDGILISICEMHKEIGRLKDVLFVVADAPGGPDKTTAFAYVQRQARLALGLDKPNQREACESRAIKEAGFDCAACPIPVCPHHDS